MNEKIKTGKDMVFVLKSVFGLDICINDSLRSILKRTGKKTDVVAKELGKAIHEKVKLEWFFLEQSLLLNALSIWVQLDCGNSRGVDKKINRKCCVYSIH